MSKSNAAADLIALKKALLALSGGQPVDGITGDLVNVLALMLFDQDTRHHRRRVKNGLKKLGVDVW